MTMAKRVFISFDAEHDEDIKNLLVGQAKNPDTPFSIADWSLKEVLSGNWKEKIKPRIRSVDLLIVLCGQFTNTATGVAAELSIGREEGKPYFLLRGRNGVACNRPTSTSMFDKMYDWTWDNLKALIAGRR
jgi:hypothetical protein